MVSRRDFLLRAGTVLGVSALPIRSAAQTARPVRLVVGFAAGGATDVLARQLAEKLRGSYPDGVIVDNRLGANGLLAVNQVKTAVADGSTLLFAPDFTFTIFPHSYRKLSFDPVSDFIPIAMVAKIRLVYAIGPAVPEDVRTLADFVKWCKANPKAAAFGSSGLGGGFHFIGVRMNRALGLDMLHVPYKGGAPLVQDLIGGQLASSPVAIGAIQPFIQTGKARVLATFSPARSPLMPDVPTMVELGYKDFVVEQWAGIFAPAKTPPAIVSKMNAAVSEVQKNKDFTEGITKLGYEVFPNTPESFAAIIAAESERWGPVVKASGYVAEE